MDLVPDLRKNDKGLEIEVYEHRHTGIETQQGAVSGLT